MRGPKPSPIELTSPQRAVLEQMVRGATSLQREVFRAKIVLALAEGGSNEEVAERLRLNRKTVRVWRQRWLAVAERVGAVEAQASDQELRAVLRAVLDDAPRSGRPNTFTPEQLCQIMAIACEKPEASGRPVTHWTPPELADEAVKREIVPKISPRSVGRFLKSGGFEAASVPLLAQPRSRGRSGGLRGRGQNHM